MEKIKLTVEQRKMLGKKVKKLRKEGILPANIFGKGFKSKAVQTDTKEFRKVFKEAGETGIVDVKMKEETYPSLIHNVQRDPVTDTITHADFQKVNLKEKISAKVPVKLIGAAPAERSGVGLILQTINEVDIESLPADIPHEIEIDISNMTEVGQNIHVKDLKIEKEKVEVKNDPEEVVISVQSAEMKEEPVEEEKTPEEVEAISEKGEEEEAEGEEKPEEGKEAKEEKAPGTENKSEEKHKE